MQSTRSAAEPIDPAWERNFVAFVRFVAGDIFVARRGQPRARKSVSGQETDEGH